MVGPPKGRKARKEKSVKTLGQALACLIATMAVSFTVSPSTASAAEDPYTPCAISSADTDGDCRADSAETPACVSVEETTKRGGMVGKDGCAVSFLACFRARPDAYYTCGDPAGVWDNPGVRSFLDGLGWVVDGKGVRHQLEPRHLPLWEGGTSGGWHGCSGDGTLHVGENALVGGKKVKTGLPLQTPPFCHSTTMDVTEKRNTIRVVETRVELDEATRTSMAAAEREAAAAHTDAAEVRRVVEDPVSGLGATRQMAKATADKVDDEETGLVAVGGRARAAKLTADDVWTEVFVDEGTPTVSRIDDIEGEVRSLRREVRERSFVLETGYAMNGLGGIHEKWTRPFLSGPLIRLGYRRNFGKWTMLVRGYWTPVNVGTDGFSVGGHVGAAARLFRLVVRRDEAGGVIDKWMEPLPVYIGATIGGGAWAVGVYTPGSGGYASLSGGGVDIDGVILVDIPKTPFTVSGSFGVRLHAVKYGREGDTGIPDPSLGIALQIRL